LAGRIGGRRVGGQRVGGQRVRGSSQVYGQEVSGGGQVSGFRVTSGGSVSERDEAEDASPAGDSDNAGVDGNEEREDDGQDLANEECEKLAHAIEMAGLSNCVYRENCNVEGGLPQELIDAGWQEKSPEELGLVASDFENGPFKAMVYYNNQTEEYVLSFSGTDEGLDWVDNAGHAMGRSTAQYRQALVLARQVNTMVNTGKLTITGHSLGGGLATAAGLAIDRQTIVYNPAALHPDFATENNLPYDQAGNLASVYHVEGEILTSAQDMGPIAVSIPGPGGIPIPVTIDGPSAPGKRIPLAPDEDWLNRNIEPSIFLPESIERGLALHGIEAVLASLEQEYQQKCGDQ